MKTWDWQYAWDIMPDLLSGLLVTIEVTVVSAVMAVLIGVPVAMAIRSRSYLLKVPVRFVLEFLRGTPLIVQIFFGFYILPQMGLTVSPFVTGVIVLGLHYSCYMAEIYRASIASIASGQWEAAVALNLSPRRTWTKIILPQALRRSVPAMATYIIALYKETALLFAIGLPVLLYEARDEGIQTFRYLEPYTIAGAMYLAVSYASARAARRLEIGFMRNA